VFPRSSYSPDPYTAPHPTPLQPTARSSREKAVSSSNPEKAMITARRSHLRLMDGARAGLASGLPRVLAAWRFQPAPCVCACE
jgi:hypothetical protein